MTMKLVGLLMMMLALYTAQAHIPVAIALAIVGLCFLFPFPQAEVVEETEEPEEIDPDSYLGIQKRVSETYRPNIGGELASAPTKPTFKDFQEFEDVGHRVKAYSAKKKRRRKKKNSLFNDIY